MLAGMVFGSRRVQLSCEHRGAECHGDPQGRDYKADTGALSEQAAGLPLQSCWGRAGQGSHGKHPAQVGGARGVDSGLLPPGSPMSRPPCRGRAPLSAPYLAGSPSEPLGSTGSASRRAWSPGPTGCALGPRRCCWAGGALAPGRPAGRWRGGWRHPAGREGLMEQLPAGRSPCGFRAELAGVPTSQES